MFDKYVKYLFLLFPLLLAGCFSDDDSHCAVPVSFTFVYEKHNHAGDRFAEEVDHLRLYVFDQSGTLAAEYPLPRTSLKGGNRFETSLPQGRYTAVSWGNIHTENFASGQTGDMANMKVGLNCIESGMLSTEEPGDLFHGILRFDVGRSGFADTVSLMKNSRIIEVRIEGVTEPDTELHAFIHSRNGHYGYDNTLHSDAEQFGYPSLEDLDDEYIYKYFQVYRLFEQDQETVLSITSSNPSPDAVVYTFEEPLVPILTKNMSGILQDKLDYADHHIVYISFNPDGTSEVKLWEEVENEKELNR